MDSFGFDFAGGDMLDLGSLGMWGGGSTPVGSSPGGGALPFSVGTPTGVQSLGDEPFAGLSAGADDFGFGDSPKLERKDDLGGAFFGAELEAASTSASTASTSASASTSTASASASAADDKAKAAVKPEQPKKEPPKPKAAASPAPSATPSAARPHIGGPSPSQPQPQPQPQQRYPPNAMMGPPGGFPGAPQGYAAMPQPQFMAPAQAQAQAQAFARPPASSYEDEFMRVKAMMMQHPDLIPPPMEVLRISMTQSGMMGSYMQQQQSRQMNMARAGYPQYGGVMMQPGMARVNPQMQGQPQVARQPPRPGGAAGGVGPGPAGAADAPTAWQSENDLPLRRKMIGKMYVGILWLSLCLPWLSWFS